MGVFKKNKSKKHKPPSSNHELNKIREENFNYISNIVSKCHHVKFVDDGNTIIFAGGYKFTVRDGHRCVLCPNGTLVDMSRIQIDKIYGLIMERQSFLMHHLRSRIMVEYIRGLRHRF